MIDETGPLTSEEFMETHNIGDPTTLARLIAEHDDEADGVGDDEADHSGCFQPHRDRNGEYVDCDGRPL
ncbi:hypothetical protein SAZ11_08355 [Streptomyces sp. FXJ1.4098]|nr:hypothetical protein [Streptomyces sp. FXJ1.4098]